MNKNVNNTNAQNTTKHKTNISTILRINAIKEINLSTFNYAALSKIHKHEHNFNG